MGIERDEKRPLTFDILKTVHPIGHCELTTVIAVPGHVVPARPDPAAAWHQARVRMKDCIVVDIVERAKQSPFLAARIGKQLEGLIRVSGNHHLIETATNTVTSDY